MARIVSVAVAGAGGYWGSKILSNLLSLGNVRIRALLAHRSPPETIRRLVPAKDLMVTRDLDRIVSRPDIDAVIVATPTDTHRAVALRAIEARKHVFLEKPPAVSSKDARALAAAAAKSGSIVVVDHIYLFSKHFVRMEKLIKRGAIGSPLHFVSHRANFGIFRKDSDSISDLAYHDIYVIRRLFDAYRPVSVTASATCAFRKTFAETASFSVRFAGGLTADAFVSWFSPSKDRRMVAAGTRGIVEFHDDSRLIVHKKRVDWTGGDYTSTDQGERVVDVGKDNNPLRDVLRHFANCVARNRESPLCNLAEGIETVRWQEAIRKSARAGRRMRIPPPS